ncbi:hypothetical protein [Paracoccus sp. (in: a-proteobacteria)]|uniref:hypothetical protein n=1 Tax=Paracoccus sp. TaxID=267 RepID=UPI0026DFEB31|nr:hypothetical protein [Paracoccus sp. (in: a-proteobacteria)]MDO5647345.1 hypothetical protein [Paracoccus sp. (in: a-proteobacteria)]
MKTWWADMPDPVLMETAWERQMNLSGMEAYEASRYREGTTDLRGSASDTKAGQKVIRRLLEVTETALEALQRESVAVAPRHRTSRSARATLVLVPAETLALLTLKTMIDRAAGCPNPNEGVNYQQTCVQLAGVVETELNFRNWVKESRNAAKAYAEAEGLTKVPRSTADRILAESKVTRSAVWKWKQTFTALSEYSWTTQEKHYCGDALITTTINALPDHFETHNATHKGVLRKYLRTTEAFRHELERIEHQISIHQTVKKPMLTKPKRWVLVND